MTDDLLSLRVAVVSNSDDDHELFRQAAASSSLPIEVVAAADAAAVNHCLAGEGADIMYVDGGLAPAELAQAIAAARAAGKPPFTVLLTVRDSRAEPFETDALAGKPPHLEAARRLLERSIRTRLPSRVLMVDDSATMRSIVRKLLTGTGFPLDVSEADEGFAALKQVRGADIDLVFLDYNMPDFSGLETLAEFKREKRRVDVVIMTSASDESLAARAREHGAAFLKKPFYAADVEAVLCRFYGFRALNPKRA